jgi:hypothetical protein
MYNLELKALYRLILRANQMAFLELKKIREKVAHA